jgi:hypothetical protein
MDLSSIRQRIVPDDDVLAAWRNLNRPLCGSLRAEGTLLGDYFGRVRKGLVVSLVV